MHIVDLGSIPSTSFSPTSIAGCRPKSKTKKELEFLRCTKIAGLCFWFYFPFENFVPQVKYVVKTSVSKIKYCNCGGSVNRAVTQYFVDWPLSTPILSKNHHAKNIITGSEQLGYLPCTGLTQHQYQAVPWPLSVDPG